VAPEIFEPAPGEIKFDQPLPPVPEDAGEEETQVTTTEASAEATPAAPQPALPKQGQYVVPNPPGQEPVQTEDTPAPAADADPGQAAAAPATDGTLPVDVLIEAGRAGLSAEDIQALHTADAIRAAIRIKGGGAAAPSPAAPGAPSTAKGQAAPVVPPELKPWEFEVPKELEDPEYFDPKVSAFLKGLTAKVKERDDAFRAHIGQLQSRPTGEAVDRTSEMMFDMTLNNKLAEDTYKPYAEKLGIGWQAELSPEEFANRQRVATVAQELYARQQSQGRTPKLGDITMQAAGIVFPEIASKLGQRTVAAKLAARPKVGRPGGGVADTRDPRQQAIDDIREAQRAMGAR